jgi:hypothetical protein
MRMKKRLRILIALSALVLLLAGAGIVLKNIILRQIRRDIQSNFEYSRLYLSTFPPTLILEKAKTYSQSPFFSAERILVKISYRSLLTRARPFNVLIEHPVLRFVESETEKEKATKFSLPFSVEEGRVVEGEFYFWGKDIRFESRGINAQFMLMKKRLAIRAEAVENVFSPSPTWPKVEGKVSLFIEGNGKEIDVKKIKVEGSDFTIDGQGRLPDFLNPELSLKTNYKVRAPFIVKFLGIPFDTQGETQGEGTLVKNAEGLSFKGDFSSSSIILNRASMGEVRGRVDLKQSGFQIVEFTIQKKSLPAEHVRICVEGGKITGAVQGFYLDPMINLTSLPWPVASPAWGNFTLDNQSLRGDGEFREVGLRLEPGRYPFRGPFKFSWDRKSEWTFSSQELVSSFARVELDGKVNVSKNLDLQIKGEVIDLNQARQFTSLLLSKKFEFPEIRGKGSADLRVFGDYDSPQIKAKFSLSPGGFGNFDVSSAEGEFEVIKNDFLGRFDINDPFIKGKIGLISNPEGVDADIRLERGFAERILPNLGIVFPLQGEASGNFEVKQKKDVQVKGSFSSPQLQLSDQNLSNASAKLEWEAGALSLSELQFVWHQGLIKGSTLIRPLTQKFDIDVQGEGVDVSFLYEGLKGVLSFSLKGKDVSGQEKAKGPFEVKDLQHPLLQRTEAKGEAELGYSEGKFALELKGNFLPGENGFNAFIILPIAEDRISVDFKGCFNNLNLLLPWKGALGSVNYLAELKGPKASPQVKAAVDFQGSVFPLPRFAQALQDYSGLMFVENSHVSLRSFQAKLGGGNVQGYGELLLGKNQVENMDLKFEGKNLILSPLERTRALADGFLNLIKDSNRFVAAGDFSIQRLSWRREINEKFVFSSSPYYQSEKVPSFFDDLSLNIRLRADDNAWLENSLGRIKGRFDLTLTGNVNAPVIMGEIEALDGDVYFQDRKFKVLSGRLTFSNPSTVQPYISFKGETYVKDYRVTFSLDGFLEHLNPEFTSSPPLPPEDVLALLALGESFQRTYSYDKSTQLSTASLVSFQLSEEAKKRAEGLFIIDRFRIDPFVLGSSAEMSARLTVGKKLSRNFFIIYSTNLTSQREEISRLEWEMSSDMSIVGTRDEKGQISFDVKIHKRF